MDVRFCILLVLLSHLRVTISVLFSGTTTENTMFYYRKLPVSPSRSVTINFNISYLRSSLKDRTPRMGIYTTYPKVNIDKQCCFIQYGQLWNENLHPLLRLGRYRTTTCKLSGSDVVIGKGTVSVQDYIPRNFYLTFGFHCDVPSIYPLQELRYNISFTKQSNETNTCTNYSVLRFAEKCSRFYHETSVPNLVGGETVSDILNSLKQSRAIQTLVFSDETCYQHLSEVVCYIMLPKCDPVTQQILHPCREMCYDLVEGYWIMLKNLLVIMGYELKYNNRPNHFYNTYISSLNIAQKLTCDYLPSVTENVPCFYKPMSCDSPPIDSNIIRIRNSTRKEVYQLHNVVQYACVNDTFKMVGNESVSCQYSGEWSTLPTCEAAKNSGISPLYIVVPLFAVPLFIIALVTVGIRHERKTIPAQSLDSLPLLKRNRQYDAFVIYHFDSDDGFVVNNILPELEEIRKFRLCIASRNFSLGCDIKDNIEKSINNSNSAIIIMSQGFVDSMWCREEFVDCYIENMKDAAFNLFSS